MNRPLRIVQLFVLLCLVNPLFIVTGCGAAETTAPPPDTTALNAETLVDAGDIKPIQSWKLPKSLKEISGLAADGSGLVYAVADERAHVFVLNPLTGATVSVFGLGNPVVKGDFEGIALHANRLYIISAKGTLLRTSLEHNLNTRAAERHDGTTLGYDAFVLDTGCLEIEGLASAPEQPWLWLVCKEIKPAVVEASAGAVNAGPIIRLEAWSTDTQKLVPDATLELPLLDVLAQTGQKKFKPSGLAFVRASHLEKEDLNEKADTPGVWDLLIISGSQRAYSRFRWPTVSSGVPGFLSAGRLHTRHRQAEGVDVGQDGTLLVADEGAGKRGRLRVYSGKALP